MNSSVTHEKPADPCPNCNGTGRIEGGVRMKLPGKEMKTYGSHKCPVCGGAGEVPATPPRRKED